MSTILSPKNAARFGADVGADALDGIYGGRPVIVVRADTASADRIRARRRIKRLERAAWRAEAAAEAADYGPVSDPMVTYAARLFGRLLDAAADQRSDGFFARENASDVLREAGNYAAAYNVHTREAYRVRFPNACRPTVTYRPATSAGFYAGPHGFYSERW